MVGGQPAEVRAVNGRETSGLWSPDTVRFLSFKVRGRGGGGEGGDLGGKY